MGEDSVRPFLEFDNKWAIVLGLTSNTGSKDFEQKKIGDNFLYKEVLKTVSTWGNENNLMFVIGATKASDFEDIRKIIPGHFLLVPGVGFQGGSLEEVSKYGLNKDCGLLENASRAIIYASGNKDFAVSSRAIAMQYQNEMATYLAAI